MFSFSVFPHACDCWLRSASPGSKDAFRRMKTNNPALREYSCCSGEAKSLCKRYFVINVRCTVP